jgi:hypothetical protein
MTSKSFALLLADLGVTKTHSRPHVSNDNPFSEANFKTLKYRPDFADRFGCEQDARGHCGRFFDWYNHEHRHGALGLCTPYEVHRGIAKQTLERRAAILDRSEPVRRPKTPRTTAFGTTWSSRCISPRPPDKSCGGRRLSKGEPRLHRDPRGEAEIGAATGHGCLALRLHRSRAVGSAQ